MSQKINVPNEIGRLKKESIHPAINPNMMFIPVGAEISPYQKRKQGADGCNLVVTKPGVAHTYDTKTELAFSNHDFKVILVGERWTQLANRAIKVKDLEKTIISQPSIELSWAHGGSHGVTYPLLG